MTKVTIIIPIYNAEKYLNKCLNSVINQTMKDIEVIAINDNSSDKTKDILDSYKKECSFLKIINNKKNYGIGYNRNLGLKEASGKYIVFVDSDDYLELDMIEKVYKKIVDDNSELAIFNYNKIDNKIISNQINIEKYKTTNLAKNPELLLDVNYSPWNKMYKKDFLLPDHKFPEDLKYEDAIFVLKALTRAKRISFINENLYNYVVHEKSETTVMNNKVFDILKITKMMVDELKKQPYYNKVDKYAEAYIVTNLFRYTIQQKNQKNFKTAKKFIDETFDYLNSAFPNWKKNKIWKKRNFIKRFIEKNKTFTKMYCRVAR